MDRLTNPLAIATCFLLVLLSACAPPVRLYGSLYSPANPAPNFTLVDQNGHQFSLARQRGNVVALYFGFTHCADICPATLAELGKARQASGVASHVRILLVSVDPTHDTPAALRAFIAKIGVRATGLTGTKSQLVRVWKAYGVSVEPNGSDVGHSDYIYFIDPRGRLRAVASTSEPLSHLSANLRNLAQS